MRKSIQLAVLFKLLPWYLAAAVLYLGACATSTTLTHNHGVALIKPLGIPGLDIVLFLFAVFVLALGLWATVEFYEHIQRARNQ